MNAQTQHKPLGIIEALSAGFDAVTRAPQVMLVPVLLDLFLWLGPRLSAYPLIKAMLAVMSALPPAPDADVRAQFAQAQAWLDTAGQQFNLFAWLSPTLLGAPSLIAGQLSDKQPLARPALIWEINSALTYLALFGLLSLLGLGLNALYWSQIAQATLNQRPGGRNWAAHAGRIWGGLLKLTLLLVIAGILIGAPVMSISLIIAMFSPALAQLAMAMGGTMFMWAAFYLVFVVHGVALREGPFFEAVRISLGLIRSQFFPSAGLLLIGLTIYLGLELVWTLPPGDSWLRGGAILGNAFVASGVLCATAFFYTDRATALFTDAQSKVEGGK